MIKIETGQFWAMPASGEVPPLLVGVFSLLETEKHGRVAGVLVQPHPSARKTGWPLVSHLPIRADALGLETGHMAKEDVPTPSQFTEGYDLWFSKFKMGEAGVFSLSVSEAYAAVVGIVDRGKND